MRFLHFFLETTRRICAIVFLGFGQNICSLQPQHRKALHPAFKAFME